MENNGENQLKVGLFVLIGTTLMLFSILLLGGDRFFLASKIKYQIQFEQVQGLAIGSVVSLKGLLIGNIASISIAKNNGGMNVIVSVDDNFSKYITTAAIAKIKTQGALGDKFIFIDPGKMDGEILAEMQFIKADSKADFLDVMSERAAELTKVIEVIEEVHTLFKNINADNRSASLMKNLVDSSKNLNTFLTEAQSTLKDIRGETEDSNKLRESLARLSSILKKVDNGEGSLGAIINDPSLHEKLVTILGDSPRNKYLKPLIRDSIKAADEKAQ